jgi:orotidine-5'-phosphate decarboxylase
MTREELVTAIKSKKSFLCVGLDSDITKIPKHLLSTEDPVFEFNKQIIDATHDLAIAYKPNLAFYESRGLEGWKSFEKTIGYLNQFDDLFIIADAKRGDIGNTSKQYAKAFFENVNVDAITVAPYMGKDSVSPFVGFEGKWVILLALTSNEGAFDFQFTESKVTGQKFYEQVLATSSRWASKDEMMYVVGATKAEMLSGIRKIVPEHFLLVPGVGAQGGSLEEVVRYGINKDCGLIVNSSRGIIFASAEKNFAEVAREKTIELQQQMEKLLKENDIIS